jgi:hypothetical protein
MFKGLALTRQRLRIDSYQTDHGQDECEIVRACASAYLRQGVLLHYVVAVFTASHWRSAECEA